MNLLDGYIASSQVMSPKEFKQNAVVNTVFEQMAYQIADGIVERRKELPDEECLFVLTCKIYTWREYKKAHPKVFKKGGK